MKIDIELQALVTEREGMVTANIERQHRGEALAYPESCFIQLASEIRALNTAELAATDSQQLKAEIAALVKEYSQMPAFRGGNYYLIFDKLRQLSAI